MFPGPRFGLQGSTLPSARKFSRSAKSGASTLRARVTANRHLDCRFGFASTTQSGLICNRPDWPKYVADHVASHGRDIVGEWDIVGTLPGSTHATGAPSGVEDICFR